MQKVSKKNILKNFDIDNIHISQSKLKKKVIKNW